MGLDATLDVTVRDDEVVFGVRAENTSDSPVKLTFSSGKTADITVYEQASVDVDSDPVWKWSDGRMFTQAIREETVQPGEEIHQEFTWANPPSGEYAALGELAANPPTEAEAAFTV